MVQRADRLSQFVSDRLPSAGAKVQLLCEDHVGTYTLPFLCRWSDDGGWASATTREMVVADVVGWREPSEGASDERASPAPRRRRHR